MAHKLYKWLGLLLSKSPSRAAPALCLDANGVTRCKKVEGRRETIESRSTGDVEPYVEDANGTFFREFLERFNLLATNTVLPCGPTLYGNDGKTSRPDYIVVPQSSSCASHMFRQRVLRKLAGSIQLASVCRMLDHRPLILSITSETLRYGKSDKSARLDIDRVMAALVRGDGR